MSHVTTYAPRISATTIISQRAEQARQPAIATTWFPACIIRTKSGACYAIPAQLPERRCNKWTKQETHHVTGYSFFKGALSPIMNERIDIDSIVAIDCLMDLTDVKTALIGYADSVVNLSTRRMGHKDNDMGDKS